MGWRFLLLGLFLVIATSAAADNYSARLIDQRVRQAVERPLPGLNTLLGQDYDAPGAPILAIGYLENRSEAGDGAWGLAIGWYLADTADGAFPGLAVIPSYQYHSDARTEPGANPSSRRDDLDRVAGRSGARFGLTGQIRAGKGRFDLSLELIAYPRGTRVVSETRKGNLDELDDAVHAAAGKLLLRAAASTSSAGAKKTGRLPAPVAGELSALAGAIARVHGKGERAVDVYGDLWRQRPDFLTAASLYLSVLQDDEERLAADLPAILAQDNMTPSGATHANYLLSTGSPNGMDPGAVVKLTRLLDRFPDSPGPWLALADVYHGEKVMYRVDDDGMWYVASPAVDHHQGDAAAIRIGLESVLRWPGYYRAWWVLSDALNDYATLVRGTRKWREIPEETRRRYRNILSVAESALMEAMDRHPSQAALHLAMLGFEAGNGRPWMHSFRRAAELAPHWRRIYQAAFNYAGEQWGGTEQQNREIYALAKRNNPGEDWPRRLRDAWAPEIKPLIDFDRPLIRWGILVVLSLLAVAGWMRWKGWI